MGMGISEFDRAQFSRASTRVVKKPCPLLAFDPAMKVFGELISKAIPAVWEGPLLLFLLVPR
jgi:hypothetical protein